MKKILIIFSIMLAFSFQKSFAVEEIVSLDDVETPAATQIQSEDVQVEEPEVTFDWLDISQDARNEQIEHYKNLLFSSNDSKIYFTKDEFKSKFSAYKKDKDYKHHYFMTNNGVTSDEDAHYCAFYYKNNTLVMYAIQYKNNPRNAFYYTAFGKLYYTDVMSDSYPNFPYTSMQYSRNGKLKSAIYFVSRDLQYMFGPDEEFHGVWYKDKMYDKNGKQSITRTNW
jgi:hypothetical protein